MANSKVEIAELLQALREHEAFMRDRLIKIQKLLRSRDCDGIRRIVSEMQGRL